MMRSGVCVTGIAAFVSQIWRAVTTWERDWKLLTGWKRWLLVAGTVHASFTDLGLLADQVGIGIGVGLPGARSLEITRACVWGFFDQHLRGRPQALLEQPSPRYPEVTFCSPEAEPRAQHTKLAKQNAALSMASPGHIPAASYAPVPRGRAKVARSPVQLPS